MLLFCIESVHSFEDCEHEARAICQTGHTTAGSRARLRRRIAALLPNPARGGRKSIQRVRRTAPWPAPRNATEDLASLLIRRQKDRDRPPDDQSWRTGGAEQLKPIPSEQPPQLRTPRQASASPLGSCPPSLDERSDAARIAGHRVAWLNNRHVGAKGQAPCRSSPQSRPREWSPPGSFAIGLDRAARSIARAARARGAVPPANKGTDHSRSMLQPHLGYGQSPRSAQLATGLLHLRNAARRSRATCHRRGSQA